MKDLDIPTGLTPCGQAAAEVIVAFLEEHKASNTGGCRAFYSPEEWAERGEASGYDRDRTALIVVHDGGEHAPYFNLDYDEWEHWKAMNAHLRKHGVYAEQCTGWYSAVYPL